MKTIVVATQNKHKLEEIASMLREFDVRVISRQEAGVPDIEIEETGRSFEENSWIKANEIMQRCGQVTLADDSGLEVDCLHGAPGVYSSRFAGTEGDDRANNAKLRQLIRDVPYEKRTARFVAVLTMLFPGGTKITARGEVEGHLVTEERGRNGFGYDPLFVPLGYDITFGEFAPEAKNAISHRGRALRHLREQLRTEGWHA